MRRLYPHPQNLRFGTQEIEQMREAGRQRVRTKNKEMEVLKSLLFSLGAGRVFKDASESGRAFA